jgi:mRNA interferase MazF
VGLRSAITGFLFETTGALIALPPVGKVSGVYNKKSGLVLAAPVTSKVKSYPFEVPLPPSLPVTGVILSDHVRSLDWNRRQAEFLCSLPSATVDEALARTRSLLA